LQILRLPTFQKTFKTLRKCSFFNWTAVACCGPKSLLLPPPNPPGSRVIPARSAPSRLLPPCHASRRLLHSPDPRAKFIFIHQIHPKSLSSSNLQLDVTSLVD
jgi:hypothetical protein